MNTGDDALLAGLLRRLVLKAASWQGGTPGGCFLTVEQSTIAVDREEFAALERLAAEEGR